MKNFWWKIKTVGWWPLIKFWLNSKKCDCAVCSMSKNKENKDKGAGKGDKPRGGFSRNYRDNYDVINWGESDKCVDARNVKKILKKPN